MQTKAHHLEFWSGKQNSARPSQKVSSTLTAAFRSMRPVCTSFTPAWSFFHSSATPKTFTFTKCVCKNSHNRTIMEDHREGFCSAGSKQPWMTGSHIGSLQHLKESDRLFVNVSHPHLLSKNYHSNYFGLFKIHWSVRMLRAWLWVQMKRSAVSGLPWDPQSFIAMQSVCLALSNHIWFWMYRLPVAVKFFWKVVQKSFRLNEH